ncbi:hypothetical protein [Pseudoalteromonas phage PH357]|nr:hypothetical protein [Pseudoalteromonas phage PH357]
MYKLVDSFMDWNCHPEDKLADGHYENILEWFKLNDEFMVFKGELQSCEGEHGYGYFGRFLITFSEVVNGMVEYKVWRDYSE